MSVDGHVLTAPITSADRNGENMQLNPPQFRLDPSEGTDFCEGHTKFNSNEAVSAADDLTGLNTSTPRVDSPDVRGNNCNNNVPKHQLEVHKEHRQHCYEVPGIEDKANEESNGHTDTSQENSYSGLRRDEIYKSLELSEFAMQDGIVNRREMGPSSDDNEIAENLEAESLRSPKAMIELEDVGFRKSSNCNGIPHSPSDILGSSPSSDIRVELDALEEGGLISDHNSSNSRIIQSQCHEKETEEQAELQLAAKGVQSSPQELLPETECTKGENMERLKEPSAEDIADLGLEISLCRNLLHGGMGSTAAAEAFDANCISQEEFKLNAASFIKSENLVVRIRQKYFSWEKAAPIVLGIVAYGWDIPVEYSNAIPVEDIDILKAKEDDSGFSRTSSGRRWSLWSISFRSKTLEHTSSNSSNERVSVDSESGSQDQQAESTPKSVGCESPHKHRVRTNVPTSDQIASLNLKEGKNTVTFIFNTRYLRVQKVEAHIYLWKGNARIVISDVDGTITKSDVLGQVMPLVGKYWTHSGIARFFSAIKDGKTLPDGPVVISPNGLFPSLFREVIRRAPHEFKIACLEDIKALFPPDYNPFYAGFGNRDTDELSYLKIKFL